MKKKMMNISMLPLECLSLIVSLTSPRDACRSSVVSSAFKEASDSDFVWKSFLPSDMKEIITKSLHFSSSSSSSSSSLSSMSSKHLYFHLRIHRQHILLAGNMNFTLEEKSGKKRYMIGSRGLSLAGEEDKLGYWEWIAAPASRFSEVAEMENQLGLHIKTHIKTKLLSPATTYAAYFVYQLQGHRYGFERNPVKFCVCLEHCRKEVVWHRVILLPPVIIPSRARYREDGWIEVEMGEFFVKEGDDATIECIVSGVHGSKSGLLVEGIEFRPKIEG